MSRFVRLLFAALAAAFLLAGVGEVTPVGAQCPEDAFRGKSLAVFGNSITAARGSWAFRVRDSLGFAAFYNGSVGSSVWGKRIRPEGTTQDYSDPDFAGVGNSSHPLIQARHNNCGVVHVQKFLADRPVFVPDYIILSYGTNDKVLEEGELGVEEMLAKEDCTLEDAFGITGGMRWCLETLKSRFPEAKIVVLSPIQVNCSLEKYKNRNRDNLRKIETMKKICDAYGVTWFDCFYGSGIDSTNVDTLLGDGLHPNPDGQAVHAAFVERCLIEKFGKTE